MSSSALVLSLLMIGVFPSPTHAGFTLVGNLNFLRDAPATRFNEADLALFRKTTMTALSDAQDGESRQWSNADTGSSGDITVLRTLPAQNDNKCRELRITNRAAGRSHTENAVFCYDATKDRWAMRPGGK